MLIDILFHPQVFSFNLIPGVIRRGVLEINVGFTRATFGVIFLY